MDLSTYARIAHTPGDANEFPEVRGANSPNTGLPGRYHLGKLFDQRQMTLLMVVLGQDDAGAFSGSPSQQARANLDALYQVLALRTQQTLARLMPDGTTRSASAECVAVNNFGNPAGGEVLILLATFVLADPYWYGASTTGPGSQSISASPTDFTFTNTGKVRSQRLTIDFTGPITNPRLTNLTNGSWVDVTKVVASAKHLIIDPYAFTALYDGADTIGTLTHGPTVPFFDLSPGANSLRVTATTPGGSLLVSQLPAYL